MKRIFKYGLMATMLAVFVFVGCKKDDDDNQDIKKRGMYLLSSTRVVYDTIRDLYGNLIYQTTIERKYDKNGNAIEELYTKTRNGDVIEEKTSERKYDDNNRIIEVYSTYGDELITYKYDEHGNLVECKTTSTNILTGETYKYNDIIEYKYNGELIIEKTWYYNGKIKEKQERSYDKNTISITGKQYGNDLFGYGKSFAFFLGRVFVYEKCIFGDTAYCSAFRTHRNNDS